MTYDIVFSEGAVKDLKNVPSKDQGKILEKIELLSENPFIRGCVKIKGTDEPLWRVRHGNYRILFQVDGDIRVIDIRRIGHRKDINRAGL